MSAKYDELLRLVVALSDACKQDKNVLKDGELVDALETHGRHIARLGKQQNKMKEKTQRITMLLPLGSNKTVKIIEEKVLDGENEAVKETIKRRKHSMDTEPKIDPLDYSHKLDALDMFPSIEVQLKSKRVCTDKCIASLQSTPKQDVVMVSTDTVDSYRSTTVAVAAKENAVMVSPLKMHQYNHIQRSVSSELKASEAVRAASPLKQLYRAASPNSGDLSASSTSTMASYYDMHDEHDVYPETTQRYARSATNRTSSFESMDWASSDDGVSDESMQFRRIANDEQQQSSVVRMLPHPSPTHDADERLNFPELHSERNGDAYYLAKESEPTSESSSRVTPVKQKHNSPVAPNSTEVVMEVLYGIMEHNENFKWLIDPSNQARVAKLVEYHLRDQHNDGASIHAFEDKQFINELRAHVDGLIHENLKIKTENVRLMEKSSQFAVGVKNVEKLERQLATSEEAFNMQEEYHRETEAVFQSERENKLRLVSSLQHDLEKKDSQITLLAENGVDSPANGDIICNPEIYRLKNTVMEKNREICRLNFQLSTKQQLVDEIAKKVVQQLETTLNISSGETLSTLANGLRLDMDMFLFSNIAEKLETIEELKAALLSMEREVSGLESRVVKKARDNLLLKTKFKSMSERLTEANVNMSRVQAENDCLVASLKEKKEKMHDLIEFLEGKEEQVMHLEEQVNLRQTQLEDVVAQYKKMQRQQLDKKSMSGHLPHRKATVCTQ
ncbi:unnamed protein product [Peronospora farinosa]|uniref:Uncharacterized protein n=1 Tax=Peronospora farinosa TaxID=134698 RepID=A0ABN8BRP8_9STRA|nr:unnamed protein product [Peronospora farinosa]